jgi:membrane protein
LFFRPNLPHRVEGILQLHDDADALFEVGKFLIGLYIGKQGLESTYGAASSLVVVLIWVYYSAQLVLLGAEFTNVRAKQRGYEPEAKQQPGRA